MLDFFLLLFDSVGFPPRWFCGSWSEGHGWLHIISDVLIFGAYLAIPMVLLYFVQRRRDVPFHSVFLLFAGFIVCCGVGHLIDAIIFWSPVYRLSGVVKAATAIVSWGTVFALIPIVPRALAFRSPEDLEREVEARTREIQAQRLLNARLAAIVECSNDAIVSHELSGLISSWNPAAERLYGYAPGEMLGADIALLNSGEAEARLSALREALLSGQRVEPVEIERARRDGSTVTVQVQLSLIRDEHGAPRGFSEIGHDISKVRRAEALFRLAVEASPSGMVAVDRAGKIILANDEALLLFGYSREELIGASVERLIPERFAGAHPDLRENYVHRPRTRRMGEGRALFARRRDGTSFPVEVGLNPIRLGDELLILCVIVDLTELTRRERALEETTRELQHKNEEIEQFVYAVSHDLKAPLITMSGFLELLQEELQAQNKEGVEDALQRVTRSTDRMKQLIDELLVLSRSGRTPIRKTNLDAEALIERLITDLDDQVREVGARVEIQRPLPQVFADPGQLERVLQNLVLNGLKYGCAGDSKLLQIGGIKAEDQVRLFVRDHGPGIPKALQERVFLPFERLSSTTKGTGIGLAIVTRIVKQHGGSVWVESEEGAGSTFWVALPRLTDSHDNP